MSKASDAPIGVFDSGLGGLTVVKEIMRHLPNEHIVYFGDTARVPYGTKSKDAIIQFSIENTQALLKYKVKMVVVACNSSSSCAIPVLKEKFKAPIVGVIKPGARKAAASTKKNRIGIIATSATVNSGAYPRWIRKFKKNAKIHAQACPLFVPLVEEGWAEKKVTVDIARQYLKELRVFKIDTLILGCTHYPLLKRTLQKVIGKKVVLVDSANEVALEVKSRLEELGLRRQKQFKPKHTFLINDKPQQFQKIAARFLGFNIKVKVEKPRV